MLAAFPLLLLPVALYNLLMLTISGGFFGTGAGARLSSPLISLPMASRAVWPISLGDLLLTGSLLILVAELLKSTGSRRIAILNQALSILTFVICLVEFLLFPAFATSTFFLIGLMVLLDVAAGFIVTLIAQRRDAGFRDG
ncbi:MAG TPA: hypothetical protein VE309_13780 [Caulobacteraceae bacterium]|jgi:hypothetical protein|nr:hypothetical protein [Caulobacteraceae bacterium]